MILGYSSEFTARGQCQTKKDWSPSHHECFLLLVLFARTFPYISFTNMTFAGSRGYRHTYFILDPLDDEVPGAVRAGEIYITSTHEKDGSAVTLPLKSDFVDGESDKRSITYPVGDNTMFGIVYGVEGDAESTLTESMTCLDVDCNTLSFTLERFDGEVRTIYNTGTMKRYPDAESWAARVNQAYDEARVPDDLRLPCPMEGDCLSDCVSEEDFCQSGDPLCSESPYQEPDAKMKPSIIAVITIVGFLLVASAFYIVYRVSVIRQGRRYRTKFAQRIADTISVEKSMRRSASIRSRKKDPKSVGLICVFLFLQSEPRALSQRIRNH